MKGKSDMRVTTWNRGKLQWHDKLGVHSVRLDNTSQRVAAAVQQRCGFTQRRGGTIFCSLRVRKQFQACRSYTRTQC